MAKYTVRCACGHDEDLTLFGKGSDRESKIKWQESVDCRDCFKEKKKNDNKKVELSIEDKKDLEEFNSRIKLSDISILKRAKEFLSKSSIELDKSKLEMVVKQLSYKELNEILK